jgi:hypothetical protein
MEQVLGEAECGAGGIRPLKQGRKRKEVNHSTAAATQPFLLGALGSGWCCGVVTWGRDSAFQPYAVQSQNVGCCMDRAPLDTSAPKGQGRVLDEDFILKNVSIKVIFNTTFIAVFLLML